MKKLLFIILLALSFVIAPLSAQAITTYNCNGLTGGSQRDLDYLAISLPLNNGDRAIVLTGTIKYHFKYSSTATDAENVATHPFKVRHDDYATAGVWIEQELATGSVDAAIIAASAVGTSEIADGIVATADLATGAVTRAKVDIPGFVVRPKFTWSIVSTSIYISSFTYDHQGSTNQLVYSSSSINYEFGSGGSNTHSTNLGVNDWFYLYIDDSAVVTAGTNVIAALQILAVIEEPVWSEAKHGHYGSAAAGNATAVDKCIGAFRTEGSARILEFFHADNLMLYADGIEDLAAAQIANDWSTEILLTVPAFARKVSVSFMYFFADTGTAAKWRTEGQASNQGHRIAFVHGDTKHGDATLDVICSSNLKIDVKEVTGGTNTLLEETHGWYFPSGM